MNKALQYFITSRFLAHLEADGYPFGVDAHLQVRDLLEKLPPQTEAKHLKNALTALLARNKDDQTEFYLVFDRISKEYVDYIAQENKILLDDTPLSTSPKEPFLTAHFWTNWERFKKISAWFEWRVLLVIGLFLALVFGVLFKIAWNQNAVLLPKKNVQNTDTLNITLGLNSPFDTIRYDTIYKDLKSVTLLAPQDTPQYIRHEIFDSTKYRYIGKDIGNSDTVGLRLMRQNAVADTVCFIFSVVKRIETEQEILTKLTKTVQNGKTQQGDNLRLLNEPKSQEHELAIHQLLPTRSTTFRWQNRYMDFWKILTIIVLSLVLFTYFYKKSEKKRLKNISQTTSESKKQTQKNNNNTTQTPQQTNTMQQNNNDVSYILERQMGAKPPYIWNLQLETPNIAPNPLLSAASVLMRRRSESEVRQFNISATVHRTIKQAGRMELVYAQRTEPNEYLILIDLPDTNAHRPRLFDTMFKAWYRAEILVERFFFNGDMRLCWNEQHRRGISLPELAQKFPNHRLLIFSNGLQLIAQDITNLAKWTSVFDTWQRKVIFTLRPCEEWDAREEALSQKFAVAPANVEGIAMAIETMDILQSQWTAPFDLTRFRKVECFDIEPIILPPSIFADPESKRNQERLYIVLKSKFAEYDEKGNIDERLLQWLAVTAIYPTLEWDWTLQLGAIVEKWAHTEGVTFSEPLVSFENLYALTRLSFFQEGKMPDNLRLMLIRWLSDNYPNLLAKIRENLQQIMEKNPPPRESVAFNEFSMTLVLNEALLNPNLRRPDLQQLLNGLAAQQPIDDFVTLRQLDRKKSELDIEIPDVWKQMLAAQTPKNAKNAAEARKKISRAQSRLEEGEIEASLAYLLTAADLLDDRDNTLKINALQEEIKIHQENEKKSNLKDKKKEYEQSKYDIDEYQRKESLQTFKVFVKNAKNLLDNGQIEEAIKSSKEFTRINKYSYMSVLIEDFEKDFNEWNMKRFAHEIPEYKVQGQFENFGRKLNNLLDEFYVSFQKK